MRRYESIVKRRVNPEGMKRGPKPTGLKSKRRRNPIVWVEGADGKKVKRGRGRPRKAVGPPPPPPPVASGSKSAAPPPMEGIQEEEEDDGGERSKRGENDPEEEEDMGELDESETRKSRRKRKPVAKLVGKPVG